MPLRNLTKLAAISVLPVLTIFTPAVSLADKSVPVKIFHRFADEPARSSRIAMFEHCSEKTGYTFEETAVPSDQYEVQLPVQLSSSNPPDIYALWPGGRSQFQAENGKILALGSHWEEIKDNIWPGIQNTATEPDGNVYGVPYTFLPNMMWYNTDVFEKAGAEVPNNWDELLVTAEKLKASGVTPFVIGARHGYEPLFWFDYFILRTAGSEFRSSLMAGEKSYLDPKVVRAMELWAELLEKGYFNDDFNSMTWREMTAEVATGRGAIQLMGPWTLNTFTDAGLTPDVDFKNFPFPEIDKEAGLAVEGAVSSFATSGGGGNTEGALALLKCTSELEPQIAYAKISQQLAVHPDVTVQTYENQEIHGFIETYYDAMRYPFHQNLELAAHPGVTEIAKREMPRFLTYPDQYMDLLNRLESRRQEIHGDL